jgi:hypothetical protein
MSVAGHLRRRPGEAEGAATGIYGTILVLAVIVGISVDPDAGVGYVLGAVLVTTLVFWAAHVYAGVLAARMASSQDRWRDVVRATLVDERPLLEAAVPPAVPLVLGVAGVFDRDTALTIAIGVGLAELFVCGAMVARDAARPHIVVLLSGVLNAGLGVLLVLLKAVLSH